MSDPDPPHDRRASRPRISVGAIINMCILMVMVIGAGVSTMLWLGGIDSRVSVLQSQMTEMKSSITDIKDWLKAVAARQK